MGSETNNNRRLFERVDANGLQIGWNLVVDGSKPQGQQVIGGYKAVVLNVSVGSARIFTSNLPEVSIGEEVIIGHGNVLGTVRVMSLSNEGHASSMQVGVDYVHLDPALHDVLMAPIHAARRSEAGDSWST